MSSAWVDAIADLDALYCSGLTQNSRPAVMPVCGPCKLLFANAVLEHEARTLCKLSSASVIEAWRIYTAGKSCSPTSAIAIAHLDLLPPIGTIKTGLFTKMSTTAKISYDADWHYSFLGAC